MQPNENSTNFLSYEIDEEEEEEAEKQTTLSFVHINNFYLILLFFSVYLNTVSLCQNELERNHIGYFIVSQTFSMRFHVHERERIEEMVNRIV